MKMKTRWLVLGISAILTMWATPAVAGWTQAAKVLAADGAADNWFGWSVSSSGGTAIVGATANDNNGSCSGSAYVFKDTGTGWTQTAKLLAADGAADDWFGWSVSISGDTAIVGARWDDDNGSYSGSAYIFKDTGSGWTQAVKLLAEDGAAEDWFGESVSISGGAAIIGAYGHDDNGANSGSAYIFKDTGSGWTQEAKLVAADGAAGDCFGYSVSISNGTAIVGAHYDDDNATNSGSAYIFQDTGSGWTQQAKLLAEDGAASDLFGRSVSISGGTAIVGADCDDDNGDDSGSAYIFQDTGTGWTQAAKLLADDGAKLDYLGESVSISGGTAIVGAACNDDNGSKSGSAYIFQDTGSGWTQEAKLLAADAAANDRFGLSVSISGGIGLVGAPWHDENGSNSGSAYIFTPEPATLLLLCGGAAAVILNRKRKP